jgi:hypothetical protein
MEEEHVYIIGGKAGKKETTRKNDINIISVENIKMNLGETEWEGLVWIGLAQDRDIWEAVMNLRAL